MLIYLYLGLEYLFQEFITNIGDLEVVTSFVMFRICHVIIHIAMY